MYLVVAASRDAAGHGKHATFASIPYSFIGVARNCFGVCQGAPVSPPLLARFLWGGQDFAGKCLFLSSRGRIACVFS